MRPGVLTFLRWEWILQKRTLRFWLGLVAYLVLTLLPAVSLYFFGDRAFGTTMGPTTFLVWTLQLQSFLGVVLGCIWAGNRSSQVAGEELWPVLSASPLSNSGFALRRSLAIALLLAPATALGTGGAAVVAWLYGAPPGAQHAVQWLVTWCLVIYLPAAIFAMAWRTLVRATGGEMTAALSTLLIFQLFGFLRAQAVDRFGWALGLDADAFGLTNFQWSSYFLVRIQAQQRTGYFGGAASEARFDLPRAVERWWSVSALTLGIALAIGLLVPLWLGRTRRDLPPLRLSEDHTLRTMGPKVYGFLQRLVPDAGLRELRWLLPAVLAVVVAVVVDDWRRQARMLDLAQRRYAAEVAGGELTPTASELRLTAWNVSGDVAADGVDLRWRGEFRLDDGAAAPVDRAAFTVDPFLEVDQIGGELGGQLGDGAAGEARAAAGAGSAVRVVDQERRWDRWIVAFDPPVQPGERLVLTARLRGRPGEVDFDLRMRYDEIASFVTVFENYQERKEAWQKSDLSLSRFEPAVSPRSIQLPASSLGPVPRYSSWQPTDPPVLPTDRGSEVPTEGGSTQARVSLDLRLADEGPQAPLQARLTPWLAASSCGGLAVADPAAGGARLVDTCDLEVHQLLVAGGRWQRSPEGRVAAAAQPRHLARLEEALPEMKTVIEASAAAWPGFDGIERLAVVESVGPYDIFGRDMMLYSNRWTRPQAHGRMVSYREAQLAQSEPLDATAVLDAVLTAELTSRRRLDVNQRWSLRAFFAALMKRRMGVGSDSAVIGQGLKPWQQSELDLPLKAVQRWNTSFLEHKVPALIIELERRVGRERLVAAVAEVLGTKTDEPVTFAEIFATLERTSGQDVSTFVGDFVDVGGLPRLALVDIRSTSGRSGWRVVGAVENRGIGEVHCPVVVRTDGAEVRETYVVPSRGRVDFSFDLASRPQFVVLDPDGLCIRLFGGAGAGAERVNLLR